MGEGEFLTGGESCWTWIWTWTWTLAVILLIFTCRLLSSSLRFFVFCQTGESTSCPTRTPERNAKSAHPSPFLRTPTGTGIISNLDLKYLIDNLNESSPDDINAIWESVVHKSTRLLSYKAKCCKTKDGDSKYLSVTTFEECSVELLLDFYMDNHYRMNWDKTVVLHEQLQQVDQDSGTEIGRTIKKFPFLTPREYVLAWRLWQGMDGSFYCFSKECEHPLVPKQKRYVRVAIFRSGWIIQKVPGRNACEIRMVHQEDAGLNVEMAKLAFAKGIWSYVCKMDDALRKYSAWKRHRGISTACAKMLIQKVPTEFEVTYKMSSSVPLKNTKAIGIGNLGTCKSNRGKITRRLSNKVIANGFILLGGALCLSRGHSSLGAKVAVAYVLSKLKKLGASRKEEGNYSVQ